MGRPLLLILDVDGVLALRNSRIDGFEPHRLVTSIGEAHELWLNPSHGVALTILEQVYDIVWATGWEHDALRILGPLLGPEYTDPDRGHGTYRPTKIPLDHLA